MTTSAQPTLDTMLRPQFRVQDYSRNEWKIGVTGAAGETLINLRIQLYHGWFTMAATSRAARSPVLAALGQGSNYTHPYSPATLEAILLRDEVDHLARAIAGPFILERVGAFMDEICDHLEMAVKSRGRHAFHGREAIAFIHDTCDGFSDD